MRTNFRTYNLAVEFFHLTQQLKLPTYLRDQLSRAASSVALNLAEGSERRTVADQRRYFHIAFGSLRECQAVLDLIQTPTTKEYALADKLAAHLYRLIENVEIRSSSQKQRADC